MEEGSKEEFAKEEEEEEVINIDESNTTPLTLEWTVGFNKDTRLGVHDLTTTGRMVSL